MSQSKEEVDKVPENDDKSEVIDSKGDNVDELPENPDPKDDPDNSKPAAEQHNIAEEFPMAFKVIAAPPVCQPGYRADSTGKCRKIM